MGHRQVVLTLPKRLRAYFLHDRQRLGLLSRVAARTLRAYVQAAVGERQAVPGLIACVQTFGSVAHLHPHLHVLMTDGAFLRDGRFVPLPEPEYAGAYATRRRVWWRRRGIELARGAARPQARGRARRAGPRSRRDGGAGRSGCGWCYRSTSRCARAAGVRRASSGSSPSLRW